jgi:hypothetical protein
MKLTTHLIVLLGMSGAVPPFSLRLHGVYRHNFIFKNAWWTVVEMIIPKLSIRRKTRAKFAV